MRKQITSIWIWRCASILRREMKSVAKHDMKFCQFVSAPFFRANLVFAFFVWFLHLFGIFAIHFNLFSISFGLKNYCDLKIVKFYSNSFRSIRYAVISGVHTCHIASLRLHSKTAQFKWQMFDLLFGCIGIRLYFAVFNSTERFESYSPSALQFRWISRILFTVFSFLVVECHEFWPLAMFSVSIFIFFFCLT